MISQLKELLELITKQKKEIGRKVGILNEARQAIETKSQEIVDIETSFSLGDRDAVTRLTEAQNYKRLAEGLLTRPVDGLLDDCQSLCSYLSRAFTALSQAEKAEKDQLVIKIAELLVPYGSKENTRSVVMGLDVFRAFSFEDTLSVSSYHGLDKHPQRFLDNVSNEENSARGLIAIAVKYESFIKEWLKADGSFVRLNNPNHSIENKS